MRKRPENSWRQANSRGIWHKLGAKNRKRYKKRPRGHDAIKWQQYSPFRDAVCRNCEFLPTCLSGCPRNQIEMQEVQKKDNFMHHRPFENQILLFHLVIDQSVGSKSTSSVTRRQSYYEL